MGEFADAGASQPDTSTTADDHAKVLDRMNSEAWEKRLEEARLKRAKILEQKKATAKPKFARAAPPDFAKPDTLIVPFEPAKQAHHKADVQADNNDAADAAAPGTAVAPLDERIEKLEAALAAVAAQPDKQTKAPARKARSLWVLAGVFLGGATAGIIAMQVPDLVGRLSGSASDAPSMNVQSSQIPTEAPAPGPRLLTGVDAMNTPPPWAGAPLPKVMTMPDGAQNSAQSFPARGTPMALRLRTPDHAAPVAVSGRSAAMPEAMTVSGLPALDRAVELDRAAGPQLPSPPMPAPTPGTPPLMLATDAQTDTSLTALQKPAHLAASVAVRGAQRPPAAANFPSGVNWASFDPVPDDRPAAARFTLASAQIAPPQIPERAGAPRPLVPTALNAPMSSPLEASLQLRRPETGAVRQTIGPIEPLALTSNQNARPFVDETAPVYERRGVGEGVVVNVFAPATIKSDALSAQLDQLQKDGFATEDVTRVNFKVSRSNVRYYHAEDAEKAADLAKSMGAEARDFSSSRNNPPQGYIELYLQGDRSAAQRSVRTTKKVRNPTAEELQARRAAQLKRQLINKLNRLNTQ